jgi:hypothetical protein
MDIHHLIESDGGLVLKALKHVISGTIVQILIRTPPKIFMIRFIAITGPSQVIGFVERGFLGKGYKIALNTGRKGYWLIANTRRFRIFFTQKGEVWVPFYPSTQK